MTEQKTCPFNNPEFQIGIDEPCPVCGVIGLYWEEIEEKCVEGLLGRKKDD